MGVSRVANESDQSKKGKAVATVTLSGAGAELLTAMEYLRRFEPHVLDDWPAERHAGIAAKDTVRAARVAAEWEVREAAAWAETGRYPLIVWMAASNIVSPSL